MVEADLIAPHATDSATQATALGWLACSSQTPRNGPTSELRHINHGPTVAVKLHAVNQSFLCQFSLGFAYIFCFGSLLWPGMTHVGWGNTGNAVWTASSAKTASIKHFDADKENPTRPLRNRKLKKEGSIWLIGILVILCHTLYSSLMFPHTQRWGKANDASGAR